MKETAAPVQHQPQKPELHHYAQKKPVSRLNGKLGSTFSSAKPGSSAEIMPTGMGAAINVAEVVNRTNEALLTRLRGLGGPGGGVIGRRHGVGLGTAVAAVAA